MIKFRLRVQLALNDMNQKSLALAAGVHASAISQICNGNIKQLPIETLDKICAVLNCQPGDLMEYIPDQPEQKEEP